MKALQGVLIFLAGGAVGAGLTYMLVKDKIEKEANAEVDELREWLIARANARCDEEITGDTLTEEHREELIERYRGYLEDLGYVAGGDDEDPVSDVNPPDDEVGIEKITSEEFTDGYSGYDSVTLTYYAGDGTWVGVDDTVIAEEDVNIAVGNDIYDEIEGIRDKISVDTESLYVVNHEQACLYEVMFLPGKFMSAE